MNDCERTLQSLHDSLAAGRGPDAAAQAHLQTCADCRAEAAEFERLESLLAEAAGRGTTPPPRLHGRIMEALAEEPTHRVRPRWPIALPLAAAAAGFIVLPLTLLRPPEPAPSLPEPVRLTLPVVRLDPDFLGAETLLADSRREYASTADGFLSLAASAGRLVELEVEPTPRPEPQ